MISRNEEQMMQLILEVANKDARIRAVLLNGSRANPNVAQDIFQDYDIIYVVTDLAPFLQDHSWIDIFGERMILQLPEDMELYPPSPELDGAFSYLMQFTDGNRIDLILVPVAHLQNFTDDSLSKVLLDKDGQYNLAALPPASDHSYVVTLPSARAFGDCCNEFWYTSAGLAKGLWRQQVTHVKGLFHQVIQEALLQMLDWHIGCQHNFTVNPGKFGKFYQQHLEPDMYARLLLTYTPATVADSWAALYAAIDLFRDTALLVAQQLGYTYPMEEDQKVMIYLKHVQHLPDNAKRIYE
ncbi:aminoglycoside 6-adenylyltransferase [Chitinophaga nivalis]|uniref:Aminoglycoside 6-adenylyltransferase n=1 Tax=Chitinophaga nivalis TaxID=2991709 RepID=A0ABT3IRL9_9BACT|nr:aminoglycoside 6-adenylyltransferase [Chitinophaga nivalis]MCW3463956.1 aminoglycoside 6-adenylyltransferase [Chitinophaga nivalis]MCW3486354.1 aminoglycoside 6-adenylyltransferase [Chitinophaga nivalis]